jgi:hypothetical protein
MAAHAALLKNGLYITSEVDFLRRLRRCPLWPSLQQCHLELDKFGLRRVFLLRDS